MNIIKSNKENIRIVANNAARPTTGKSDVFYYTLDNNLLSASINTSDDSPYN